MNYILNLIKDSGDALRSVKVVGHVNEFVDDTTLIEFIQDWKSLRAIDTQRIVSDTFL